MFSLQVKGNAIASTAPLYQLSHQHIINCLLLCETCVLQKYHVNFPCIFSVFGVLLLTTYIELLNDTPFKQFPKFCIWCQLECCCEHSLVYIDYSFFYKMQFSRLLKTYSKFWLFPNFSTQKIQIINLEMHLSSLVKTDAN